MLRGRDTVRTTLVPDEVIAAIDGDQRLTKLGRRMLTAFVELGWDLAIEVSEQFSRRKHLRDEE